MNMKIREREKETNILIMIMINTIKDLMVEILMTMMIKIIDIVIMITMIDKKEIAITKIVKELIEGITILKLSLKSSLLKLIEKLRKKIFRKSFLNLEKLSTFNGRNNMLS